jgi:lipooligosaccharide transport system permease protein
MRETLVLSAHIVRRNWWVYRKDFFANISPTLADPAFLMMSLGVGLGAFVNSVQGHSYLGYLAPGLAVSTAMFTAFFETSYGFYVRMTFENVFKAMLTTPIGVDELVIGEFLWVALKGALMIFCVSLVLAAFGQMVHPINLLLMPLVGVLIAVPLGAMGLFASCLVKNINQFQTVYSFVISPLYFFSGIFFPVEQMPHYVQWVCKALPLYHAVRLSQAVFWNEEIAATWSVHVPVLLLYGLILSTWSYIKVRRLLQT